MHKKREHEKLNPEMAADIAETEGAMPTEIDEASALRAQLAQCQQELAESKNTLLRAHADFDNFRKRMRAERDQEFSRGSDRVISELLPVVDDLERALAASNGAENTGSFRQGIELINRQINNLLGRYGITAMTVEGQPFDPKYHDAVARVEIASHPEHTIIGEVQRGYLKNGEVFRPAKVAVSVKPDAPEDESLNG